MMNLLNSFFRQGQDQGDQMIWKTLPNFLKSCPNNPNNAKIQTIFLTAYFGQNVVSLYLKLSPFLVLSSFQKITMSLQKVA
jgi:hypothetical protein